MNNCGSCAILGSSSGIVYLKGSNGSFYSLRGLLIIDYSNKSISGFTFSAGSLNC